MPDHALACKCDDGHLPAVAQSPKVKQRVVYLLEELSPRHLKAVLAVEYVGSAMGLTATVLSYVYRNAAVNVHRVNLGVAIMCLLALSTVAGISVGHGLAVRRRRLVWPPRVKRLVSLHFAVLILQAANVALLVGGLGTILAHPCEPLRPPEQAIMFLRGTAYNCILLLLLVDAKCTHPWLDRSGNWVTHAGPYPLVLDAPFWEHWQAGILWLLTQGTTVILFVGLKAKARGLYNTNLVDQLCQPWRCRVPAWLQAISIIHALLFICYLFLFIGLMWCGFRRLRAQSYSGYLCANLAIRLQAKGAAVPYLIMNLSWSMMSFRGISCASTLTGTFSDVSVTIIVSTVASINGLLHMPRRADGQHVTQEFLRWFAWVEADVPAVRNAVVQEVPDDSASAAELVPPPPLPPPPPPPAVFCFQTALQMMQWSRLAYKYKPGPMAGSSQTASTTSSASGELYVSGDQHRMGNQAAPVNVLLSATSTQRSASSTSTGATTRSSACREAALEDWEVPDALRMYGLTALEDVRDQSVGSRALLAWGPEAVVLAFRGTASWRNARTDLQVLLRPYAVLPADAMHRPAAHSGFAASWFACKPAIMERLRQLLYTGQVDRTSARVFVTGHSLGGAMAALAAFDIAKDARMALRPDQITCYAIAAPRAGNHSFARMHAQAVPDTWNVINDQDMIPQGAKFLFYKRPGQRAVMNGRGLLLIRPGPLESRLHLALPWGHSVSDHYLSAHFRAAVAVVQAQFTSSCFAEGEQGARALLAVPECRRLLESVGLDCRALQGVATKPSRPLEDTV